MYCIQARLNGSLLRSTGPGLISLVLATGIFSGCQHQQVQSKPVETAVELSSDNEELIAVQEPAGFDHRQLLNPSIADYDFESCYTPPKVPMLVSHFKPEATGQCAVGTRGRTDYETPGLDENDKAPPLEPEEWIIGSFDGTWDPDKLYVFSTFSSGCSPARILVPILSAMQDHHGDRIQAIMISNQTPDALRRFLLQRAGNGSLNAEAFTFTLGSDPDGSLYNDWMGGKWAWPSVYIVSEGDIVWHGNWGSVDDEVNRRLAAAEEN